jgi:hypothetical protein
VHELRSFQLFVNNCLQIAGERLLLGHQTRGGTCSTGVAGCGGCMRYGLCEWGVVINKLLGSVAWFGGTQKHALEHDALQKQWKTNLMLCYSV